MKLQLSAAALLVLAITGASAAKCKAGDEEETVLGAMATLLPIAAAVCDVKDPSVGANFYALKPCNNKDCVDALNAFVAATPSCEDETGENVHKGIKAVTDTCGATGGSKSGSKSGTVAKNETAPAATTSNAPKTDASKTPAPAPTKSAAAGTTAVSVAAVGLASVAWFATA